MGDDGLPSFSQTQAASDGERGVRLVYYAFDLLHLDGRDTAGLPLIERKALLKPLVADMPGLQFNGHETGDGELIRKHACELGFEGVVSKTIDAPYAPGNRGLWRKSKCLNRQEFVVVGWTDPEGSRPHLGALLLGYYTDDGKLIYAGRVGTGMPDKVLADLRRRLEPLARSEVAAQRAAAAQDPLRIAARALARALGRAAARRRDHLFDLDRRRAACATRSTSGSDPTSPQPRSAGKRRTKADGRAVLVVFDFSGYRRRAMNEPAEYLTPADPRDLAEALAFALRFQGRKRVHNADEIMAEIVAKRLVDHLDRAVS